jgi:hypothetical protein
MAKMFIALSDKEEEETDDAITELETVEKE